MFIKDEGTKKPDIWKKNDDTQVNNTNMMGNQIQPIIYIIDASKLGFGNNYENGRRKRSGERFFDNLFYVTYKIKRIIKFILIVGIIITAVILISNPGLINKIMMLILRKTGIYGFIMNIKRLLK